METPLYFGFFLRAMDYFLLLQMLKEICFFDNNSVAIFGTQWFRHFA